MNVKMFMMKFNGLLKETISLLWSACQNKSYKVLDNAKQKEIKTLK